MSGSVVRAQPPSPGALVPFRFPQFSRARLANRVEVIVAHTKAAPLVGLGVLANAGGGVSPLAQPGLSALHASLLDEGTSSHDAMAIARSIERLGGSLETGVDWDVMAVQAGMLATHLDDGLALTAEIVFDAKFPESEVERLRQQRLGEILRHRDSPAILASRYFADTVYGGTVYGWPLVGTESSIEAITRDELLEFYRRHLVPAGLTVVAVGDIDPEVAMARIEQRFGHWQPAGEPAQRTPIEPQPGARRVIVVDRPGAVQTELKLGHVSVPRSAPDYPARVLLNAILGGTFSSRLNLNLRERLGLTYGVRSSFARRTGPGPFVVGTAVATDGAGVAVAEILDEIDAIRDQGVTAAELEQAQRFLIGVFPYTVETVGDLAQRIEDLVVFGLEDDYYERHPASLADVGTDDVREAAQQYLDPARTTIVAVGPADTLCAQLARFGPIDVITP